MPDTRAAAFCTQDSDCATGSVCLRGNCRARCPSGTHVECQRIDVAFDVCSAERLCTNALERQSPECARSADCAAGLACVNARCR